MSEQKAEQTASVKTWVITVVLAVAIIAGAYYMREKQDQGASHEVSPVVTEQATLKPIEPSPAALPSEGGKETEKLQAVTAAHEKLAGTLKLTVPVLWPDNNRLPLTHSCHRKNISFPVQWAGAPKKTKSFVLMMDKVSDAGGKAAEAYNYWLLYNIPGDSNGLGEDMPKGPELEDGTRFGRNDHGVVQYTGPCDPRGKVNYRLTLVALDTALALPAGANKEALVEAMADHVLDRAEQPILHYLRF